MPDPLTQDDVEAILRGGGSATDKPQRAARMALEKRAMGPDFLTEGELWSWVRSVMCQGADIRVDYDMGNHNGYEAYSARLDAAASERAAELYNARIVPDLQAAARLGAERERERAARVCNDAVNEFEARLDAGKGVWPQAGYVRDSVWDQWIGGRNAARTLEEAIRRGEGE